MSYATELTAIKKETIKLIAPYQEKKDIETKKLNDIRWRRTHLKISYKISLEDYNEMLKRQNGKCAICELAEERRRLSIDHNHKTGQIRGLLCCKCNFAVGYVEVNDIQKVVKYIAKYE